MNNLLKALAMSKDFDIKHLENDEIEVYPMKSYPHFYARFTNGTYYIIDSEYVELNDDTCMIRNKAVEFRDKLKELRKTAFGYIISDDDYEEINSLVDFCEFIIKED